MSIDQPEFVKEILYITSPFNQSVSYILALLAQGGGSQTVTIRCSAAILKAVVLCFYSSYVFLFDINFRVLMFVSKVIQIIKCTCTVFIDNFRNFSNN